jgi:protein TonB
MNIRQTPMLALAALALTACQAPAPPPSKASAEPPAPIAAVKPEVAAPVPESESPKSMARLAPANPVLDEWKQRAAERIHQVNRKDLFEGRPEHLLRAVIIVEITVDRQGNVTNSNIRRSPSIASLNAAALRQLRNASPLPAPPAALLSRGALTYHETWLVRKDGRFQLRSLALPQE